MSQSFLESQIAEQPQTEQPAMKQHDQNGTLALSANDFSALEERIVRAVNLVKSERQARASAEQRAESLETRLQEQSALVKSLQEEMRILNSERDQVRQRVERLLSQLDALEV
jgi:DNA repair exonuclease SbcCD ATPase subunit